MNPGTSKVFGDMRSTLETRSGGMSSAARQRAETALTSAGSYKAYRAETMPHLIKGYGMHREGGVTPLNDIRQERDLAREADEIFQRCIEGGFKNMMNPKRTAKSFSGPFAQAINGLNRLSPQSIALGIMAKQWSKQISQAIGKSFNLGTITGTGFTGGSPLASGFVPFDLLPFVRTIYPVYTPLRNKVPRVPGQGEFHRGKILASISGSLPGSLGTLVDDSTTEFFGGGGFGTWPNPLPASGTQTAYDITIPYKFFALTESTSWLAQFAGQGFDDIYGLASLVLLQEFMLLEEHDMLCSSSQALAQPAAPTTAARAAGTGETTLSGVTTNVFVLVTALNYWGETQYTAGNVATQAWSAGQVIDVTIAPVPGALAYRIYTATGAANPGRAGFFPWVLNTNINNSVGSSRFTLYGALPTTGTNPPAADTGTSAATRQESLLSVLSGLAYNSGSGPYPNVSAGYFNNAIGLQLTVDVISNALLQMFNGSTGYFANPSEIITSPNEAYILAQSIRNETVAAFQFRVQQSEMAGVTGGIAVSNIVNPVTRTSPEILPHPYLTQGNTLLMSYTLPQTQNNLGNVVENVMVQDYAQIGWPVIDPTFRQSILRFGTFFFPAPQYCGLIQGTQKSASTPYS